MICNRLVMPVRRVAQFNSSFSFDAVTEMIETDIDKKTRVVSARKRDASVTTTPRKIEIGTSDTRDAQWRERRAGRA